MLGVPEDAVLVQGHVEPESLGQARFDVPGTISSVEVAEGDRVRKGQVLARLDTSERRERLTDARSRLRSARSAAPGGGAAGPGEKPPEYLDREMRRRRQEAEAVAGRSSADRDRLRRTVEREGEEAAAQEAIRIASRRSGGVRRSSVSRRAAEDRLALELVDDLSQRVRQLQDAIEDSVLRSPASGTVVSVNVREGGKWNTRGVEPAFEVLDPDSFVIRVAVPSLLAARMMRREEVRVELRPGEEPVSGWLERSTAAEFLLEGPGGEMTPMRDLIVALDSRDLVGLEVGQDVRVAIRP